MRRAFGLVCAVLCVLGLTTATAQAAADRSPGRVHQLHAVSHSSASVRLSWRLPSSRAFRSTVVRYAAGTRAPRGVHAGRSASRASRTRHTLTVTGLRSGRSYAFSVFALGTDKHAGPRVSTVITVAPAADTAVATFATASSTDLTWTNPTTRSFSRVVVRLAKGAAAPTGPFRGRAVHVVGARATSAQLTGLARNTTYAVSVWAFDRAGNWSTPGVARFTTSAGASPDGTVTGVVRDTAGHGLADAGVSLEGQTSGGRLSAVTTPDGHFRVSAPAGTYVLEVDTQRVSGGVSASGYVGTSVVVVVHSGRFSTVPALTLAAGAEVTGRVVDEAGRPVAGARLYTAFVTPYITADSSGVFYAYSYELDDSTPTSGADGRYVLRGVPADGVVRLCASPPDTAHTAACTERTLLPVVGTSRAAADVMLGAGQGGTVTGTVRGSGAVALANAVVSLEGSGVNGGYYYAVTDDAGHFQVPGVAPGRYRVCARSATVTPDHPTGFAAACGPRSVVDAGVHVRRDVTLPVGAALTGTVRGPGGHRVVGAVVNAQGSAGGQPARTNSHGQYVLTGLTPGRISICVSTDGAVVAGAPTGVRPACGRRRDRIAVTAGRERSGADVRLALGGAISGTVRAADGKPAAYVDVNAEQDVDDDDGAFSDVETDAAGHYTLRGLPAGRYHLCFDIFSTAGDTSESCHRPAVRVTTGHTAGVDGRLPAVTGIRVTVHDTGGQAVAGVDAVALTSCPEECDPQPLFDAKRGVTIDASQSTDSYGSAVLGGLRPGSHAVCLYAFNATTRSGGAPTGYADTCSGHTFGVTVRRGQVTSLSLVLPDGGAVSGTITDGGGHPLAGARPLVSQSGATDYVDSSDFTPDGLDSTAPDSPVNFGASAADGTYTVIGVQPGARTVCVDATHATGGTAPAGYRDGCRGAAPGATTGGNPVTVRADSTTTGANIVLAPAGGISGTVRHGTSALAGAMVTVFSPVDDELLADTSTDAEGRYLVAGLDPRKGKVEVCFSNSDRPGQCWKGIAWTPKDPPPGRATLITVTGGVVVSGVDATLR